MSAQLLELLIFAGIAFFLINKLISMLGTNDEGYVPPSRFGDNGEIKDVTSSYQEAKSTNNNKVSQLIKNIANAGSVFAGKYDAFIEEDKKSVVYEGFKRIAVESGSFDPERFITGAKKAIPMIIEVARSGVKEDIEQLIDRRFVDAFLKGLEKYPLHIPSDEVKLTINDVYFFAHNAFIKMRVEFSPHLSEEWIFSKNLQNTGPNWIFCNIG